MECTVCRERLQPSVYEGTIVKRCPSCAGIFIQPQVLAKVANDEIVPRAEPERQAAAETASRRAATDLSRVGTRRCPQCGGVMRRFTYAFSSGVVVDGCDEHGIWLDAGELERIEAWAEAERRGMVASAAQRRPGFTAPGAPT